MVGSMYRNLREGVLEFLAARPDAFHDTRAVTMAILDYEPDEWASSADVKGIRAALNRLERQGKVWRFGYVAQWTIRLPGERSIADAFGRVVDLATHDPEEALDRMLAEKRAERRRLQEPAMHKAGAAPSA